MKNQFFKELQFSVGLTRKQMDKKIQQKLYATWEEEKDTIEESNKKEMQNRIMQFGNLFDDFEEKIDLLSTRNIFKVDKLLEKPRNPKDEKIMEIYQKATQRIQKEIKQKKDGLEGRYMEKVIIQEEAHLMGRIVEGRVLLQDFDYYLEIIEKQKQSSQNKDRDCNSNSSIL